MSQIIEVKVPDIGDFAEVPVIELYVKVGDSIKVDDAIATLESDKATMDVPSTVSGVIKEVLVQLGSKVSEGDLLFTLDSRQMRMLAHIARKYDRDYGHFTTRQNIQYNWIKLEECPDLLADLASVEMHAIQTSGNCIRNISSDQYAGAAADEVADPRPCGEVIRPRGW